MSKIKFSEELKSLIIKMRLEGKTSPEIEAATGMGRSSQQKLYRERGIKLTPEQKDAATSGARWKKHQPIVDGKKLCSACDKMVAVEDFYKSKSRKTGYTSACKACNYSEYTANPEPKKERVRKYREVNPEKIEKLNRDAYVKNKEAYVAKAKQWALKNPEKRKAISNAYGKRNQPAKNGRTAKYRATKIKATPAWLSETDLKAVADIYKNCPKGYHVDHIVPLRGDEVSGLHVPWNLQYLPGVENMSKGNKLVK